jgi:hypothetical protein
VAVADAVSYLSHQVPAGLSLHLLTLSSSAFEFEEPHVFQRTIQSSGLVHGHEPQVLIQAGVTLGWGQGLRWGSGTHRPLNRNLVLSEPLFPFYSTTNNIPHTSNFSLQYFTAPHNPTHILSYNLRK